MDWLICEYLFVGFVTVVRIARPMTFWQPWPTYTFDWRRLVAMLVIAVTWPVFVWTFIFTHELRSVRA